MSSCSLHSSSCIDALVPASRVKFTALPTRKGRVPLLLSFSQLSCPLLLCSSASHRSPLHPNEFLNKEGLQDRGTDTQQKTGEITVSLAIHIINEDS